METKYMVMGGVGVVLIGGFLFIKSRQPAQEESVDPGLTAADAGYYSSIAPLAGGYTSASQTSAYVSDSPSVAGNSGSTATSGGFDISSLLSGLTDVMKSNSNQQVKAQEHVSDSAVLATIFKPGYGSVSVSHTDNGTTINSGMSGVDSIVYNEYQSVLGRAPDEAGFAFWKNSLINGGVTIADLHKGFVNSDEKKSLDAKAQPTVKA